MDVRLQKHSARFLLDWCVCSLSSSLHHLLHNLRLFLLFLLHLFSNIMHTSLLYNACTFCTPKGTIARYLIYTFLLGTSYTSR